MYFASDFGLHPLRVLLYVWNRLLRHGWSPGNVQGSWLCLHTLLYRTCNPIYVLLPVFLVKQGWIKSDNHQCLWCLKCDH